MSFRDRPMAVWGLPLVTLLVATTVLGADVFGLTTALRGSLFDHFQRAHPRPYVEVAAHPVRVLDIDADAIRQFGAWPWPHGALAALIEAAKTQGASIVVYDEALDRPDPLSPQSLLAGLPNGPATAPARAVITALASPDTALAEAMGGLKTVTGFRLGDDGAPPAIKAPLKWSGSKAPFAKVPDFETAAGSLPLFEAASAGIGAQALSADRDLIVRRAPLVFLLKGKPVPTLDAEVLRLSLAKPALTLMSDDGNSGFFGGVPAVLSLESPNGPVATAGDGSVWLSFSGPQRRRHIAASALLDGKLPPHSLKNAILFIGDPAERVATPFGAMSLAELHAEAAENLVLGTTLRRPLAAEQAELLCLVLFGIGCALIIARVGVRVAALYGLAVTAVTLFGAWRLFVSGHVLFDALGLTLALWLVWGTGAAARLAEVLRTRRALRRAFSDVLPPDVIARIAQSPTPMKLDGENRIVTYLSCGIRGFSELAASFRGDPAAFTRLIQRVLDPLMAEALAHGGAIDRLTAEGFTAYWNAPLDDPDHGVHACEAGMGMMQAMAHLNELITHERRQDGEALAPVEIGVGIASGQAIAGGFKVHGRTAYSVNGDCAVEAARLRELSAQYGPAVIVSEEARKIAERGFAFLEIDYAALQGGGEPVKLYALLGNSVMRASPKFRALATFHDHIFQAMREQHWGKARALIAQCRKLSGASQKLYELHLSRIAYFEDHPPAADWDGAFRQILL